MFFYADYKPAFGVDRVEDILIPWNDVKGERWPGEY